MRNRFIYFHQALPSENFQEKCGRDVSYGYRSTLMLIFVFIINAADGFPFCFSLLSLSVNAIFDSRVAARGYSRLI